MSSRTIKKTRLKKWFIVLLAIIILFISFIIKSNDKKFISQQEKQQIDDINAKVSEEISQELIKDEINKKSFINYVSNTKSFIVLTINGKCSISHDRTPENNFFTEWLNNSQIDIRFDYSAIYAINTKDIRFIHTNNDIKIEYDYSSIKVSSIDMKDAYSIVAKSVFGSAYTPNECMALINISKNNIEDELNTNKEYLVLAKNNFEELLRELAEDFLVDEIHINIIN